MRIIIEDVPDDLARELLALIGRQGTTTVTVTPEWTPTRAEHLLRDLPAIAAQVIREAAAGNGWAPADKLRGPDGTDSLRGRTGAITKAITRGAKANRWPVGMETPVAAQYDPEIPSYQRTIGFIMPEHLLLPFQMAIHNIDHRDDI